MFLITIPLAFTAPTIMLLSWIAIGPLLGHLANRRRPAGAYYD